MRIVKLSMVLAGLILLATVQALYGLVDPLDNFTDQLMRLAMIIYAGAAFGCAILLHIMRRR